MPLDLDIKVSDVIAAIALLISVLSAVYARGQRIAAERANLIAVRESRRPLRLQVFQSMHHFSKYCSTYWTLYHMGEVNRSRELTEGAIQTDVVKRHFESHPSSKRASGDWRGLGVAPTCARRYGHATRRRDV